MVAFRGLRPAVAGLLVLSAAACSVDDPGAESTPSAPDSTPTASLTPSPTPTAEGPAPAWTARHTGRSLVAAGDVLLLSSSTSVRGLLRTTGAEVWHRTMAKGDKLVDTPVTAGGVALRMRRGEDKVWVDVVDPATGGSKWHSDPTSSATVYRDAVYLDSCWRRTRPCTITSRDVRTGRVRWTIRSRGSGGVDESAIGARRGYAPAAGAYLAIHVDGKSSLQGAYGAIETATGRIMPARLPAAGWYGIAVGNLLVSTDHDGTSDCTVRISTVDVRTGKSRQLVELQSAQEAERKCVHFLANYEQGQELLGTGNRIVAVNGDRPVVFDLATRKIVWTGNGPGFPADSDGRSLLVRAGVDKGGLALLDLANGRTRWTAPDPGPTASWPGWYTAVTGKLVAVDAEIAGQSSVIVYDAQDGKRLGSYPGRLAGVGDGWVAVSRDGSVSLVPF